MARKTRAKVQARGRPSGLDKYLEEITEQPDRDFRALKRPQNARFEAFVSEDGKRAELDIYDVIGCDTCNAAQVRAVLNEITASEIVVNINSPGGAVFDGFAIYSDLRSHPARIKTRISGLAASAASVIAMAGDEIEIAENAFLMIHNAWTIELGDRNDFARTARFLGQIDKRLANTYAQRAGGKAEDFAAMMDEETWFDADDAVEAGLADRTAEAVDASALAHDVSKYSNAPAAVRRAQSAKVGAGRTESAPVADDQFEAAIAARIDALANTIAAATAAR
jgi:ATP-dependent Clp protease protease subunit